MLRISENLKKESNVDLYLKGEIPYDFLNDVEEDIVEQIQLEQRKNEIQLILDEGYVYSEKEEKEYKQELEEIVYALEHFYED